MDKRILFTFILVLAFCACSSEPEWKFIRTGYDSDNNVHFDSYIKPKSILIKGSERKFWVKYIYKKELKLKSGKTYTEELVFIFEDCSKKTLIVIEGAFLALTIL